MEATGTPGVRINGGISHREVRTPSSVPVTTAVVQTTPNLGQDETRTLCARILWVRRSEGANLLLPLYNVWALLGRLEGSGLLDIRRWDSCKGSRLGCLGVGAGCRRGSQLEHPHLASLCGYLGFRARCLGFKSEHPKRTRQDAASAFMI